MGDLEILPGQVDGPLQIEAIFGRRAPLEIEVGIGKGRFLLSEAERRPGTDFLGLEWSLKHLRLAKGSVNEIPGPKTEHRWQEMFVETTCFAQLEGSRVRLLYTVGAPALDRPQGVPERGLKQ